MGAHVTCKISERSHVVEQVHEAKWPTKSWPSKSARRSGRPGPTKQVREIGRPYRPYQESQQGVNSSKASRSPRQLGQYMTTPEAEASHANDRPRARRVTAIDMIVPPQVRPHTRSHYLEGLDDPVHKGPQHWSFYSDPNIG
jgi:hypothetical protein